MPALPAAATALLLVACSGGGSGDVLAPPEAVDFLVTNSAGLPVLAATVYLVPAGAVDGTPFSSAEVNTGQAADRDEPLEDAVRLGGGAFPQGVTDAEGRARIVPVPEGRYFWFVRPAPADAEHLPGGSGCRTARHTTSFLGTTVTVTVSSRPMSSAPVDFVGSSTCLFCHPGYDGVAEHPHRLGFVVPGQPAELQDPVRYPLFQDGWDRFLPAASHQGGTVVWFSDFDPNRGFDKFKTSLTDPTPQGETVYVKAFLWKDTSDDRFKITLENVINPADPRSPLTLEVPLTYGGAVYKQRHLVRVPGRNGLYVFLQFQTEGDDARFARTRRVYRDYHLDHFWDAANSLFVDPPASETFDGNCTGCHATGLVRFQDPVTQEWLTDAVDDFRGVFDIDGDGTKDEINVGCESCHGAGVDHAVWAADPANQGMEGRFVVTPENLSPSRELMLCGRCHGRPLGNGPVQNDEPLDPQGRTAPPGVSREDFLADHTVRPAPAPGNHWSDGYHSRSHHQHYEDMLKSRMHRNDRILTTCTDCHASHGEAGFRRHLVADPADPDSTLCARCHAQDLFTHMQAQTGTTHAGNQTTCVRCHMAETAQSGAGRFGILLGTPMGGPGDDSITFFQNDISSHLFLDIPRKTHEDVAGMLPADAMPIPYTRSCGSPCHNAGQLPNLSPVPWTPDSTGPFGGSPDPEQAGARSPGSGGHGGERR